MVSELPLEAQRFADAAQGWLGLGDHFSADMELDQIPVELRLHPTVLRLRLRIYGKSKRWEACAEAADALVSAAPDIADGWISRSFALHTLNRTQEAHDLLLPAAGRFPNRWPIPYSLACCCCRLERYQEAEEWLKQAMAINEKVVKCIVVDEPDLKPLLKSKTSKASS